MLTWGEFAADEPALAEAGRGLFCQFGVALAFLGTTARDGSPRLHPITPQLTDAGLFAFITPSPNLDDLVRDGRYALHSYPGPTNKDAFYITGRVRLVTASAERETLLSLHLGNPNREGTLPPLSSQTVFELLLARALLTRTTGHGGTPCGAPDRPDKKRPPRHVAGAVYFLQLPG